MDFAALLAQELRQAASTTSAPSPRTTPPLPVTTPSWQPRWWRHPPPEIQCEGGPDLVYVPDVVRDCAALLRCVETTRGWTRLARRELLNLGGVPHVDGLLEEPLPGWLQDLIVALAGREGDDDDAPNQALINRYAPGGGIAPHMDGPLFRPRAAILSLSGHAVLRFWDNHGKGGTEVASLILEPGSLCIFSGPDFYSRFKHGILPCDGTEELTASLDTVRNRHLVRDPDLLRAVPRVATRVSITLRHAHVAQRIPLDRDEEVKRREAWWRAAVDEKEEERARYD